MSREPTVRTGLPFWTTNALTNSATPTPASTLAMPAPAGRQKSAMSQTYDRRL